MKEEETRPKWTFDGVTEKQFRALGDIRKIKEIRVKSSIGCSWERTDWLEVKREGENRWKRIPDSVRRFIHLTTTSGSGNLLELDHVGHAMKVRIDEIDEFDKEHAEDIEKYKELKRKLGF